MTHHLPKTTPESAALQFEAVFDFEEVRYAPWKVVDENSQH